MQRISFAPVLSATRSRDSCWITSLLLCLRSALVGQPVFRAPPPTHARTAEALAVQAPRPSGPWKPLTQNGPAVHGTRTTAGPVDRDLYLAFSTTSTSRHRLVADVGRVSMICTRSPTPATLFSSWAFSLLVRRMTLP